MAVKNFVLMKENTCRSNLISQNYTSYYQLTVPESNRLNTPVIFAWLSKKSISKQQMVKNTSKMSRTTKRRRRFMSRCSLCVAVQRSPLSSNRSFLSYKNSHFQKKAKCETFSCVNEFQICMRYKKVSSSECQRALWW